MARRRVPYSQCRDDAIGLQSATARGGSDQRVAVGAEGSGKGELATAFLADFGFFCVTPLRGALGCGPAGLSSATTGLGSALVEAGVEKSPAIWTTCTGTVSGWNLFSVYVTE